MLYFHFNSPRNVYLAQHNSHSRITPQKLFFLLGIIVTSIYVSIFFIFFSKLTQQNSPFIFTLVLFIYIVYFVYYLATPNSTNVLTYFLLVIYQCLLYFVFQLNHDTITLNKQTQFSYIIYFSVVCLTLNLQFAKLNKITFISTNLLLFKFSLMVFFSKTQP